MMYTVTSLLILTLVGLCYAEQKITYSGYSLYRATPQRSSQVSGLRSLMNDDDNDGIEFWREPNRPHESVDIMVSPDKHDFLKTKLRVMRIPNELIMDDVGEVIEKTSPAMEAPRLKHTFRDNSTTSLHNSPDYLSPQAFYSKFQRYGDIEAKLEDLSQDPRVTLEVAGSSYEGRKLYLLKISSDPNAKKPVIFLDAGHHAREWISHSTLMYIMESLLSDNMPLAGSTTKLIPKMAFNNNNLDSEDEDEDDLCLADNETTAATTINYNNSRAADATAAAATAAAYKTLNLKSQLDKYDFWFLPVVNPDGYEYSHTHNRLWRKTRSGSRSLWPVCMGTDPNRNYPVDWAVAGAGRSPCDETYAGPKPLSEPETETLANTLINNQDRIVMYLSLHAYSQVILSPYGHARVYPPNYAELSRIARAGMNALAEVRGTTYRFGTSAILMYPASGGSDDYAYSKANIEIAYTIELPDTGRRGFLLPPTEIVPVGQETVVGLSAMIDALL